MWQKSQIQLYTQSIFLLFIRTQTITVLYWTHTPQTRSHCKTNVHYCTISHSPIVPEHMHIGHCCLEDCLQISQQNHHRLAVHDRYMYTHNRIIADLLWTTYTHTILNDIKVKSLLVVYLYPAQSIYFMSIATCINPYNIVDTLYISKGGEYMEMGGVH